MVQERLDGLLLIVVERKILKRFNSDAIRLQLGGIVPSIALPLN